MTKLRYKSTNQKDAFTSPWSLNEVILIRLWNIVWRIFFRLSPKYFRYWRIFLLRLFGAKVDWSAFIYPTAKIYIPWLLTMEGRSCLGPYSEVYNLGPVKIKNFATISQYVYICNGTHDLSDSKLPLMIGDILIGENVFIGAKALILPGIKIGDGAVIGAGSVVTKDVESYTIVGGNPARFLKKRLINSK
ncbi:MAG: acetyltransferase [Ignavibacterium album]|uniref:DapH/DapD/GlmU-related protein n=1 Tax=Ignavibacterium album TaxID=591197 RepID=UPI00350E568B|nr:acetyltransferase [Ignavibacterium album]